MRAFFHLKGLIETGLEDIVDEGVRNPRFTLFDHHRHLQIEGFAVDDGRFRPRFNLHVSAVFDQGIHLRVVIPLNVCAEILQGFIHRDHMRFAAVGERRALPGAKQGDSQRHSRLAGGKNRHCDLTLLLCCAVPLRMSACLSLS
ncbi:Uncharacterised protein [Klebsiella oxytoca]|nr:Uncharacterised protein [Klebsiella oxytoca]